MIEEKRFILLKKLYKKPVYILSLSPEIEGMVNEGYLNYEDGKISKITITEEGRELYNLERSIRKNLLFKLFYPLLQGF